MSTITIYGASDDLVEVEGEFEEEFTAYNGWRGRVVAPSGQNLIVTAEYSKTGGDYWTLGVETTGTWPAWDIQFAEAPHEGTPALIIEVPAGTIVEEIQR